MIIRLKYPFSSFLGENVKKYPVFGRFATEFSNNALLTKIP